MRNRTAALMVLVLLFQFISNGISAQHLDSIVYRIYNSSQQDWNLNQKIDYIYNENGNVTTEVFYTYYNGQWNCDYGYDFVYDASDNLTIKYSYTYCASEGIAHSLRQDYIYNPTGNVVSEMRYAWYPELMEWNPVVNLEYTYNESDKVTLIIGEYFEGGLWNNYYKEEFVYDEIGNLLSQTFFISEGEYFIEDHKNEMTYDQDNKKLSNIHSIYGEIHSKHEFIYDENDVLTQVTSYLRESTNWTIESKVEFEYDSNGNIIQQAFSTYNGLVWSLILKYDHTYNSDIVLDFFSPHLNQIVPHFEHAIDFSEHTINKPIRYVKTSANNKEDGTYFYSDVTTGATNVDYISTVDLFPNPTSGLLNVKSNSQIENLNAKIYTHSGELVLSMIVIGNTIDLSNLNAGLYVIKFVDGVSVYSKKIIKI